jgi:L-seryl-tRNA(Ser) seleniumtransferase
MRLPPWAIEAIRNGVADVARKASDAETISKVREQAVELLRDLPENASRGIDAIMKTASETARGAIDQGRDSILRWKARQTDLAVSCLNASGTLFSAAGTGLPVSDHVLQLGCDILRGDCVEDGLRDHLDRSLTKLLDVDGRSVAVTSHLDAAVTALGALASSRAIVMHRSQAIRLPSGNPLPDAFAGIPLQECGGVQTIEASDFDGIDEACVILADDGNREVRPIDFAGRDVITIAILPFASINQPLADLPCASTLLRSGIDLVVLSGGPATGGVTAGILAGRVSLIESIRNDRRWRTCRASDGVAAMTLAALTDAEPSPLTVLIQTSEDNLRSRAERMATRLAGDESIAVSQLTDEHATLVQGSRWRFPSRQIRLRHRSLSAETWANRLRKQTPAILTKIDGRDLVIDLRWVPAGGDPQLAEALAPSDELDSDSPE